MLNLIFGRNYNNKTEYVRNLAAQKIREGGDGLIIIVPEQFSFDTEKGMLEKVGAAGMQHLDVLSLTRLAEIVFEKTGRKNDRKTADAGVKLLTMNLALEELSDRLHIFRRYVSRPVLTQSIIALASELKQYSVSTQELESFAKSRKQSALRSKLEELTLIIDAYNAMLEKSYFNTEDSLTVLADLLCDYRYFEGRTVIIDEFTRFTKQELGIIEKIISQSDDTFITFNTDYNSLNGEFSVFDNINSQVKLIKRIADRCSVSIAKPVVITQTEDKTDENLAVLEENIYRAQKERFENTVPESITVYRADNRVDECNYTAACIKRLMREKNVRCRDIIVYQREKGRYDSELTAAFRRYGVPFFEDRRQPVEMQPLMVYVKVLLEMCCNSVNTQSVMRLLKTGLTELEDEEIAELENYAFIWNIKTSQWKDGFTEHPAGFGNEMRPEDEKQLERLNALRRKAVNPIFELKNSFQTADAQHKTELLYAFLKKNGIDAKLKALCTKLAEQGETELLTEQNSVWKLMMDMLDKLYLTTQGRELSSKRYYELFTLLVAATDLGTLPKSLDSVTLALADRTRAGLKRYVFIIGANDGVFPKNPSTEGLLNDTERLELKNAGIELAETAEYKSVEENYTAYRAVCSATDGLFVTYTKADYSGEAMLESSIVNEIRSVFPSVRELSSDDINPIDAIESEASAFEVFAKHCKASDVIGASVEEFFKCDETYKGRVTTLKNALYKKEKVINDKELATKLFGKNMYISASKTEAYHQCPFMYFCRYGIKAMPLKQAEVDNLLSGTIIHEVFEKMLKEYSAEELKVMDDSVLKEKISHILYAFLDEKMGGEYSKSKRFMAQYNSLADRLTDVFKRMVEEFELSLFRPVDFELPIGSDKGVPAYTVELDDGSVLSLTGSIDRVDIMETDECKYLRIIDYKKNGKDFKIGEVFCGINMQMLIYLFALYANGKEKYGDFVPSGVLYMAAKNASPSLPRNATQQDIDDKRLHSGRMSGLLIDDMTALEGMERGLNGYFIPVYYDKKGNLTKNYISLEAMLKLKQQIDLVLKKTAEDLHNGIIKVFPSEKACSFCDYSTVCGFEQGDSMLDIPSLDIGQAEQILLNEGEVSEDE